MRLPVLMPVLVTITTIAGMCIITALRFAWYRVIAHLRATARLPLTITTIITGRTFTLYPALVSPSGVAGNPSFAGAELFFARLPNPYLS